MNRIELRLESLKQNGRKAFITYMTAGLPDMEGTKNIIKIQEQAGTDIIELGIPFSDPVADGPVIQQASYESIQKGTNIFKIFAMMAELRKECGIPIVFMLYYNTILHFGIDKFVANCIFSGVDGLIIPDLPLEEQGELRECLERDNAPILIQLVAPVSKQRIPEILKDARGFVYCVSSMGVTGQQAGFYRDVKNYLKQVSGISKIPVMMGFGIQNASDVEQLRDVIDGCIVGSRFIRLMKDSGYDPSAITDYIQTFQRQLNH